METVSVQLLNKKSIKLLKQLEELHLIKVIDDITAPKKSATQKLSDRFEGKLSDDDAKVLHQHIKQIRSEWDRAI